MHRFFVTYTNQIADLPAKELLSSVFLFALDGSKILAIINERGWDIPGGHIELGESPDEALIREVKEEGGAIFANPRLFAIVGSDDAGHYKDKVMLFYVTNEFTLGEFVPSHDAFGREVIEIEEFLRRYRSDSNLDFEKIIRRAQEVLGAG
jgi:ADP-ribose pyrophosphatase YjhB (NUDIX family)